MFSKRLIFTSSVLWLPLIAACNREAPAPQQSATPQPTTLRFAIPDRTNHSASIASFGKMVAVVWTAAKDSVSDIYISVSNDGGASFGAPMRVNDVEGDARASGEQAARVVMDKTIHVVWPARRETGTLLRYASSADGGRTFSKAVSIAGEGLTGLRGWHSVTLGYDGGVHVAWLDTRNGKPSASPERSRRGGRHSGHGAHQGHGQTAGQAAKPAAPREDPRQDVFHASWKGDGPRSEGLVATHVCFCCKTAIATSGDRVYAAWRHIYPGGIRDIAVARSIDNGATFEAPVRLSEDGWKIDACPDDGPAMVSDSHGGIHIAWPTLVSGDTPRKAVFYASRTEQGTFTPRLRMDSGDADTAHPQIATDEHGNSAVVWDERNGDVRRIVLRPVSNGVAGKPEAFVGQSVSYPVVTFAEGHWVVLWASQGADGGSVIEGRRMLLH